MSLGSGESIFRGRAAAGRATEAIDSGDLRRLLEELHPDSFAWSVSCCRGDAVEGTEVLQTSYLKVLSGAARFDGLSSPRTWFFGVVRRTAQERRRRAVLTGRILTLLAQRPSQAGADPPNQETRLESSERTRALRTALWKLPERQRQVLTLVFQHDLTLDDAARSLGIAPGSARAHYERGKKRLRELLSESEVWNERA